MKKSKLMFLVSILALAGLTGCNKVDNNGVDANDLKVESVSLDVAYKSLEVGESFTLTPTIKFKDDQEVDCYKEWRTSNDKLVTVNDQGLVLALKSGSAAITFIAGYKSASCSIYIPSDDVVPVVPEDPDNPVTPGEFTISLDTKSITLKIGDSFQLNATTSEQAVVSWSSSDDAVASVDGGLIDAKKEGSTG